ncbi:MAG: hypothetical protein ACRECH_12265 [Nitrososphaerales archaeon]
MKKIPVQQVLLQRSLKRAIELYGLKFDNKLDQLLGTGLKANTLTYLYGKRVSTILNILALNSVRHFGGRALFVDAGNSADPYLIRREADLRKKDSMATRKLLQSIEMMRVFTCHQLTNFVVEQLPALLSKNAASESQFKFVGLSGFDFVFSEDDSPKREIMNLQYLIAQKLEDVSKDKNNGVMFVVASSEHQCSHFLDRSDVAIEIYHNKKSGRDRAALMRHHSQCGVELEL